jgi:thymidylate kinase
VTALLVAVDGPKGSGKTTLTRMATEILEDRDQTVVLTKEPTPGEDKVRPGRRVGKPAGW